MATPAKNIVEVDVDDLNLSAVVRELRRKNNLLLCPTKKLDKNPISLLRFQILSRDAVDDQEKTSDLMLTAEQKLQEGDYRTANDLYIEALGCAGNSKKVVANIYLILSEIAMMRMEDSEEEPFEENQDTFSREALAYCENAVTTLSEVKDDSDEVKTKTYNSVAKAGNIMFQLKAIDEAKEKYSMVFEHGSQINESTNMMMVYNCGILDSQEGNYDDAYTKLMYTYNHREAIHEYALPIDSLNLLYYLGLISLLTAKYDKAQKYFLDFLQHDSEVSALSNDFDVGLVHRTVGAIYEKRLDNPSLALDHYFLFLVDKLGLPNQDPSSIYVTVLKVRRKDEDVVSVFYRIGNIYFELEKYENAAHCFTEVYNARNIDCSDKEKWSMTELLDKVILCQRKMNNVEQVISTLKEKISIAESLELDMNSYVEVSDTISELDELLRSKGDIPGATAVCCKLLDIKHQHLSPKDIEIGQLKAKIGVDYFKLEYFEKAMQSCQNAEQIARHNHDCKTRVVALIVMGKIYAIQQSKYECIQAFQGALSEQKRESGKNNYKVSNILVQYAHACLKLDMVDESLDCFADAYTIRMKCRPKSDQKCINILQTMADVFRNNRRFKEAIITCGTILESQKENVVPPYMDIAQTYETIGDVQTLMGGKLSYHHAVENYQRAANIIRRKTGKDNDKLMFLFVKMGSLLGQKLHDYTAALNIYRHVIKTYKFDDEGRRPQYVVHSWIGEADMYVAKQYIEKAITRYQHVLSYLTEGELTLTVYHERLVFKIDVLFKLGRLYAIQKEYKKSIEILSQCLYARVILDTEAEAKVLMPLPEILNEIGLAYKGGGNDKAALEYFQEALQVIESTGKRDEKYQALSKKIEHNKHTRPSGFFLRSLFPKQSRLS